MSNPRNPDRWFFCRAARPRAAVRLFCLPFAGCGASAFNSWPAAFPETVEVSAIQLPGRESRYSEPAFTDAYDAARSISEAIEPYLDRRYAVLGYSMGALIAFELMRELRRRSIRMPEQLFVAARIAPQVPGTHPPLAQLPLKTFIERVRYYYQPPEEAWANPTLLELIMPVLREDMALCDRYVYTPEPPFDVPIQAFAGLNDRSAPLAKVEAWREQTRADFQLDVIDGAHFFTNADVTRMQNVVISCLERYLR